MTYLLAEDNLPYDRASFRAASACSSGKQRITRRQAKMSTIYQLLHISYISRRCYRLFAWLYIKYIDISSAPSLTPLLSTQIAYYAGWWAREIRATNFNYIPIGIICILSKYPDQELDDCYIIFQQVGSPYTRGFSSRLTHYVAVILYYAFRTCPLLSQYCHLLLFLLFLLHAVEDGFTFPQTLKSIGTRHPHEHYQLNGGTKFLASCMVLSVSYFDLLCVDPGSYVSPKLWICKVADLFC
jgi:hypothetical protein